MSSDTAGRILESGAAGMLVAAFALAWMATFHRLMPNAVVRRLVKDYRAIISAHLDLLLMALFCLAFADMRVALPKVACTLVVLGGFTNPSLFVLRGLYPDLAQTRALRTYRVVSFSISTCGFMWLAAIIAARSLV